MSNVYYFFLNQLITNDADGDLLCVSGTRSSTASHKNQEQSEMR